MKIFAGAVNFKSGIDILSDFKSWGKYHIHLKIPVKTRKNSQQAL
jgi:hypothetical protein